MAVSRRVARFVDAYITNGHNARAAGLAMGMSKKSVDNQVKALMKQHPVQSMVADRMNELALPLEFSAREVIASLARAIRFDPALMYAADGRLLPVREMPDSVRLELEGVEVDEVIKMGKKDAGIKITTSKVKHTKKSAARDQAMRYFGLNAKDKVPYSGEEDDGAPVLPVKVTIEFKDARKKR